MSSIRDLINNPEDSIPTNTDIHNDSSIQISNISLHPESQDINVQSNNTINSEPQSQLQPNDFQNQNIITPTPVTPADDLGINLQSQQPILYSQVSIPSSNQIASVKNTSIFSNVSNLNSNPTSNPTSNNSSRNSTPNIESHNHTPNPHQHHNHGNHTKDNVKFPTKLPDVPPNEKASDLIGGANVRRWLNEKVTPSLLEGMRMIAKEKPDKPLEMLGKFFMEKSKLLESENENDIQMNENENEEENN